MDNKCPSPNCWVPEPEMFCNLGETDLSKCPNWRKRAKDAVRPVSTITENLLPWTGNSFGTVDLEFIAARSNPTLIGVVGAHNAGKTTLLAVIYLLLARGHRLDNRIFAGSYTLGGWEHLAHWLRWQPSSAPAFPPHTPRTAGRVPGLLHIALRDEERLLQDLLLTDAPGEWFERWAVDRNASDGEGARWINRFSNSFMFLIDCDALSSPGPGRGTAELQTGLMLERLGEDLEHRKVAVVWAKSDKQVPVGARQRLTAKFARYLHEYKEFEITVQQHPRHDDDGYRVFIDIMSWLIHKERPEPPSSLLLEITHPDDYFLAFRGIEKHGK
jgi:hypothetical protein